MAQDTLIVRRCAECKNLFKEYGGAVVILLHGKFGPSEEIELCKACRQSAEESD